MEKINKTTLNQMEMKMKHNGNYETQLKHGKRKLTVIKTYTTQEKRSQISSNLSSRFLHQECREKKTEQIYSK